MSDGGQLLPLFCQLSHLLQNNVGTGIGEDGVGQRTAIDGDSKAAGGGTGLDTQWRVLDNDAFPRL